MDTMAVGTRQLVFAMQARAAAGVRFCLGVAGEAIAIQLICRQFRVGLDLGAVTGVHMCLPGAVAGLTTLVFPSFLGVGLENLVRVARELRRQLLVAGSTGG